MAAAAGSLEIVRLGRLDTAKTGAAAHHVYDDAGQFGADDIADAFLL
jgi:hypothetical protein